MYGSFEPIDEASPVLPLYSLQILLSLVTGSAKEYHHFGLMLFFLMLNEHHIFSP
jgi:hypothetical protein